MEESVDDKINLQLHGKSNEHSLVLADNANILIRVKNSIRKFFFKGKMKNLLLEDGKNTNLDESKFTLIQNDTGFVQEEILNARKAYRKYVINNSKNISTEILSFIKEKIKDNESKIRELIEMNEDDISYEEILEIWENEEKATSEFKLKNDETNRYNVPIGVIGVECDNSKEAIENIFRAISTRNAIIILHNNYNEYSIESLILLIVKECLKMFYIDDNIIQMDEKISIEINKLDKVIEKDKDITDKNVSNTIYVYQENDKFRDQAISEVETLQKSDEYKSYNIQLIKGEFGNIINYLNTNTSPAVCMYTQNAQKAYKFINWVNCENVFVNTGIQSFDDMVGNNNKFYNSKYVLHRGVF